MDDLTPQGNGTMWPGWSGPWDSISPLGLNKPHEKSCTRAITAEYAAFMMLARISAMVAIRPSVITSWVIGSAFASLDASGVKLLNSPNALNPPSAYHHRQI